MKPINECQTCKKLTTVPNKDYGVCTRARKINKNKNPYRAFNDVCPGYSKDGE